MRYRDTASTVVDRSDYSAKMLAMLGDRDTYQLMAKDPTTSLENRMNSVLLRLRREGRLSGKTYYVLLKKLVQLGCISEGFLCGSHQPKVLTHKTFWQLTTAFISGNGLQSVCVICVKVTANDEWNKIKLKLKMKWTFVDCLWVGT